MKCIGSIAQGVILKTKTNNKTTQQHNNKTRTIVRVFQCTGRKVAKRNPPKDERSAAYHIYRKLLW